MPRLGLHTSRLVQNPRFSEFFLLIRNAGGSYANGLYTPGAAETLTIRGTQQIASDDDRQNLPEGERLREARTVWVRSRDKNLIRPVRFGADNTPGDIIQIGGINYECFFVDNFSNYQHIKAICVRQENQSDS